MPTSDTDANGLYVRVLEGATQTFYLVSGPERKHLKPGRYPVISVALARMLARIIVAEKTLGTYTARSARMSAISRLSTLPHSSQRTSPERQRKRWPTPYPSPNGPWRAWLGLLLALIDEVPIGLSQRRDLFVACSTFLMRTAWNHYINNSSSLCLRALRVI
jgi:hypothetical protein